MTRFVIYSVGAALLLPLFGSQELFAQRPFERFQKDVSGFRPDGRILRQLFGDDEDGEDAREKARAERENTWERIRAEREKEWERIREDMERDWERFSRPQSYRRDREPAPSTQPAPRTERPAPAPRPTRKHPEKLEVELRADEGSNGVLVSDIRKSGAAWAAGIREGDVITHIGGVETESPESIEAIVDILKDGDQIEFDVQRNGRKQKVLVRFGNIPESAGDDDSWIQNVRPSRSNTSAYSDYGGGKRVLNEKANSNLNAVINDSLNPAKSSRSGSSRNRSGEFDPKWQVEPPPSRSPNAGGAPTTPSVLPAPTSNRVQLLQQQLEQKQREIQELQRQIREAGQELPIKEDPMLDSLFDSGN